MEKPKASLERSEGSLKHGCRASAWFGRTAFSAVCSSPFPQQLKDDGVEPGLSAYRAEMEYHHEPVDKYGRVRESSSTISISTAWKEFQKSLVEEGSYHRR